MSKAKDDAIRKRLELIQGVLNNNPYLDTIPVYRKDLLLIMNACWEHLNGPKKSTTPESTASGSSANRQPEAVANDTQER